MSQIVYTITKENSSDPWIIAQAPYAEACCSAEEMSSIILPYRADVSALPGLEEKTVSEVDDKTIAITYKFDSDDNMDNGIGFLKHNSTERRDLMIEKRKALNLQYTMSVVMTRGVA